MVHSSFWVFKSLLGAKPGLVPTQMAHSVLYTSAKKWNGAEKNCWFRIKLKANEQARYWIMTFVNVECSKGKTGQWGQGTGVWLREGVYEKMKTASQVYNFMINLMRYKRVEWTHLKANLSTRLWRFIKHSKRCAAHSTAFSLLLIQLTGLLISLRVR